MPQMSIALKVLSFTITNLSILWKQLQADRHCAIQLQHLDPLAAKLDSTCASLKKLLGMESKKQVMSVGIKPATSRLARVCLTFMASLWHCLRPCPLKTLSIYHQANFQVLADSLCRMDSAKHVHLHKDPIAPFSFTLGYSGPTTHCIMLSGIKLTVKLGSFSSLGGCS